MDPLINDITHLSRNPQCSPSVTESEAPSITENSQQLTHTEGVRRSDIADNFRSGYLSGLSGMDCLPAEIVGYIFKSYVDATTDLDKLSNAPFVLGAICHRWRIVSQRTPSLWTTLFFRLECEPKSQSRVKLGLEWLRRSGQLPLSITLQNASQGPRELDIVPLITFINKSLHRCIHLDLRSFTESTDNMWKPAKKPSIMKTLRINRHNYYSPLLFGQHVAPTRLDIVGVGMRSLDISRANITHFSGSSMFLNAIMELLKVAPQMTTFCVRRVVINCESTLLYDSEVIKNQVTSVNLHTLTFGVLNDESNNAAAVAFFTLTTFPSLKRCSTEIISGFPTAEFLSFLNRSLCSLTEFSVQDGTISPNNLVRIAKAQPSITTLKILPPSPDWQKYMFGYHDLRGFLQNLCEDNTDPSLLPDLQHLSIWTDFHFAWSNLPRVRFPSPDDDTVFADDIHLPADLTRGRVGLASIAVSYIIRRPLSSRNKREAVLISDWNTFYTLLELKKLLFLNIQVEVIEEKIDDSARSGRNTSYESKGSQDAFEASYAKLTVTQGEPPQHIRESEIFLSWVQKYHQ